MSLVATRVAHSLKFGVTSLPKDLRPLFWDIETKDFDPKKYPRYTIERILEFGDEKAARWVFSNFSKAQIQETCGKSRQLSERSRKFWKLFLKQNTNGCESKQNLS